MSALAPLPQRPGAYRWYYADVACGEVSAVAIFLVGSLFSPRYAADGRALPTEHCAVNFALYVGGRRRQWVLSEYRGGTQAGASKPSTTKHARTGTRQHAAAMPPGAPLLAREA